MKLKDEAGWLKAVEVNKDDSYSNAVTIYAESWADLMENRMAEGKSLAEVADKASHDANVEGITGFMYGCAVSILSQVWEHGEELRCWHNLKMKLGKEGEKANESGGVLNPALLNIS